MKNSAPIGTNSWLWFQTDQVQLTAQSQSEVKILKHMYNHVLYSLRSCLPFSYHTNSIGFGCSWSCLQLMVDQLGIIVATLH